MDVIIVDEANRELEIITPWRNEYHALRIGMTIMTVVASKTKSFDDVYNVADAYVPAAGGLWLGDYPFLQKPLFRRVCKKELPDSMNYNEKDEDSGDIGANVEYEINTTEMSEEEIRRRRFKSEDEQVNSDGYESTRFSRMATSSNRKKSSWEVFENEEEELDAIVVNREINDASNNNHNRNHLR